MKTTNILLVAIVYIILLLGFCISMDKGHTVAAVIFGLLNAALNAALYMHKSSSKTSPNL